MQLATCFHRLFLTLLACTVFPATALATPDSAAIPEKTRQPQVSGLPVRYEAMPDARPFRTAVRSNNQTTFVRRDIIVRQENDALSIHFLCNPAIHLGVGITVREGTYSLRLERVPLQATYTIDIHVDEAALTLDKQTYAIGDTLMGYIDVKFTETVRNRGNPFTTRSGTSTTHESSSYYFKGPFSAVVRPVDFDPRDDASIATYTTLALAISELHDRGQASELRFRPDGSYEVTSLEERSSHGHDSFDTDNDPFADPRVDNGTGPLFIPVDDREMYDCTPIAALEAERQKIFADRGDPNLILWEVVWGIGPDCFYGTGCNDTLIMWFERGGKDDWRRLGYKRWEGRASFCEPTNEKNDEVQELERRAAQGETEAQYDLGHKYWRGWGVAADNGKALRWFWRAAKNDHAQAQLHLGRMFAAGHGVAINERKAEAWYQKAVAQGDAAMLRDLGCQYLFGRDAPQDDHKAMELFQKAADRGDVLGQHNMGFMYFNGRSVANDDRKAVEWFLKAANQGFDISQLALGEMYALGRGVVKNTRKAVALWKKAADQGNARAQYSLGEMYENGHGTAKDVRRAVEWYRQASKQGNEDAKKAMARFTEGALAALFDDEFLNLCKKGALQQIADALHKGANVAARDAHGRTPLMWALLLNPNPEVITILLELGADPKAKDDSGNMPIDYARNNEKLRDTDIFRKLEEMSR